ncbi:MAG TPA: prolyl oligopeptidase family serine peptidase [Solirubrobacteraceae bacterium]|nr:prolyl oligopeptidase family serine peptidase [Solirubrobacteraceae bacterium]
MTSPERIDTPRIAVSETYHGVRITEDYRWLEDATSEETKEWTAAQNARTRAFLDSRPSYGAVRQRAEAIARAESVSWGRGSYGEEFEGPRKAGSAYLVLKHEPPKQQPVLVALADLDDASGARAVVDPNVVDDTGATTIDWFAPSPDGRLVAVSLSSHGTEEGTLHLFAVGTGEPVDVSIPRVHGGTAGGSLAWAGDSSWFWYTRGPGPDERPQEDLAFFQEVWRHVVGEPLDRDRRDQPGPLADPRIVEHFLEPSPDGRWVMDRTQKGDGGEWQVFVRAQHGGEWWQVAEISDRCVWAVFGSDALYMLSRASSPRGRVLRLSLRDGVTVSQAECVVPAAEVTIEGLAATEGRLWLLDIDGGPSGLRVSDPDGANLKRVDVPPVSAIESLGRLNAHEVVYAIESFTRPRVWWRARDDASPRPTALADESLFDLSTYDVRREFATSADGTQVPMTLMSAPGTRRDGSAAALLTGYGGFGVSLKPRFDLTRLLWLEQGGVFVVANLRGGGEYGEEWHHGGRRTTKQHVFDDFLACARYLVDSGVTSSERLAIIGGSNGGLLIGATLTQHPELARAVVALVPVMDMLRAELHPNGAFVAEEFGTVHDPDLFETLLAYSPYHNVRDGTAYPATLLTGGEFDPRVDAYHPRKMAARLQAATSSSQPVLLRIESGGHGIGSSLDETIAKLTDTYTFIFDRLGIAYRPA